MMKPSATLLLVEDNQADAELVRRAFAEIDLPVELSVVHTAMQALDYLLRRAPYENTPSPRLILLDLELPGMNGKELLTLIKQDEQLRSIPIIIFTHSCAFSDILETYGNQANSYIVKPGNLEELVGMVRQVETYLRQIAQACGEAA